ncbi:similar to Saccharomyces cerevisiae YGR286C BIO2 Biotin synthase, catalyzes the conversion of dethiobiotin to biotin, which is the last step of the biotin biosynthesis pathway [Maudiozyma saulgeensis]|uniref:biotin synthase n=1 Tax=Maudiozyma saulgeensis TaxID=1789683 RepID=A0A1X7RAI2_9SACH|nr:similar to Saccharomyces cerevisiae YGR286C BIO2 Biotin synthase, catalyzes the conversion of dethiobiotin to biotin, which is the last step of the biotin biosynthesis pathway [Kazachstania saulgeensis]
MILYYHPNHFKTTVTMKFLNRAQRPVLFTGKRYLSTPTNNNIDVVHRAISASEPIHFWSKNDIKSIYETPLLNLIFAAQTQHRRFNDPTKVQLCTLMNIKTGGCTENCSYCSQSSSNNTGLKAEKLVSVEEVKEEALLAKKNGSTRFCLGAAWRSMDGRKSALKTISKMVQTVNDIGLESCVTLGMLDKSHSDTLKDAGLSAYNCNIDTSREHYKNIVSTRTYDDRLRTLNNVSKSGIKVCTGGILGLGESHDDRIGFLYTLSNTNPHPESVPINRLVEIDGTKIVNDLKKSKNPKLKFEDIVRTIATARIIMPKTMIRLAAGRYTMREYEQFICFMAGCNSIFTGKDMLTTPCNGWDEDKVMLAKWGLEPLKPFSTTSI